MQLLFDTFAAGADRQFEQAAAMDVQTSRSTVGGEAKTSAVGGKHFQHEKYRFYLVHRVSFFQENYVEESFKKKFGYRHAIRFKGFADKLKAAARADLLPAFYTYSRRYRPVLMS